MSRQASGLMAWLIQRLSAVYLAFWLLYLLVHFMFAPPQDQAALRAWLGDPWVSVALSLGVVALLAHAWIGARDVLIDYVRSLALRLGLLSLLALVLTASGLIALQAILTAALAA